MTALRGSYLSIVWLLLVLTASCDEFPGIDVIGVRQGPDDGIVVTKPLCPGDRVTEVSLVFAPEGVPRFDEGDIFWRITSEEGSTQEDYVVGVTPTGFAEDVPLTRSLGSAMGLAATIDTEREAEALEIFEPRELRVDELLTPDGYLEPAAFEAQHLERCRD
jgi:hypothetical protein